MSDDRVHRISAFPAGVWWVRWIDSVSIISAIPGTPTVKVVLSPLPPAPARTIQLADVAKDPTGAQMVEVAIGLIVGLAIGMIFEDGVLVDRLIAEERRFDFELPRDLVGGIAANSEPPIERPVWWTVPRYDVISASAYPRVLRPDSFCCVLQQEFDKVIAVIPAAEVVRAFIATDSNLATAAFAGPWATALGAMVDESASRIDDDGNWRVVARGKGVGKSAVVQVGSLMPMFNPAGSKAANLLHTTVIAEGARISAALPFDDRRLRFTARCLELHRGKYLVTEITEAEWPHRQGVVLVELGPLEDLDGDAVQRSYPVDTLALSHSRDEPVDVVSDEAPAQLAEMAASSAASVWGGLPVPQVVAGDPRPRPDRMPVPKPSSVASMAAVGVSSSAATVAQASLGQGIRLPACDRFEATAVMFDDLATRRDIVSWRPVPEPGRNHMRGERPVWSFSMRMPGRRGSWRFIDRARRVYRSALICEIVLVGSHAAYWIEIEPRPGEMFQSLAFTVDPRKFARSAASLLNHAAASRGVWGASSGLISAVGLRDAGTWRHRSLKGGGQNGARALSVISALR